MEQLLWSLVPWGYQVLLDLQRMRTGPLDVFFSIITDLGSNLGYLVILSVIYWCVDKRSGQRLAYLSLTSATLNIWIKEIWKIPRPGDIALEGVLQRARIEGRVSPLRGSTLPAFPSGHAQGAAVTWGYIAHRANSGQNKKRWVWYVAVALTVLVAFSRLYLGVHFPQDVIAGLMIGIVYLVIWLWAEPHVRAWLAAIDVRWRYVLAAIVPLAILAVHPGEDTTAAMGAMLGLGVGYILEGRALRFDVRGTLLTRAVRGMLGLVLTLAAYFVLRAVFGLVYLEGVGGLGWQMLRYAVLGFAVGWGVPWVFVRTGLAEQVA